MTLGAPSDAKRADLLSGSAPAAERRDHWIVASTDLDADRVAALTEAARHRVALALLRWEGVERKWKRGYGSSEPAAERMWTLVAAHLRDSPGPPPAVLDLDLDLTAPASEALHELARSARETLAAPLERAAMLARESIAAPLQRAVEIVRQPMQDFTERIAQMVRSIADSFSNAVRSSALRESVRMLRSQQMRVEHEVGKPLVALLRAHRVHVGQERPGRPPDIIVGDEAPTPPDEATLAAYYAGDRGDSNWRMREVGWLLVALPLSVGGALHKHFGVSVPAGLGFVAERFARHEMSKHLQEAINDLACSESLRQRLGDGVTSFMQGRYHSADTLLSAGLDGLLFQTARSRGLLSPGDKLLKGGKATGGKIKTGSDGRLLNALKLEHSKQAFLTEVSAGKPGNRPRHGEDADVGSREHAAAALLGVLLLLAEQGNSRALARALV